MINRRVFVKSGGLALLALGLPPEFVTRSLLAQSPAAGRKKTLICIFQRGAVDGLNMIVPFGEQAYYRSRNAIAVPTPALQNARGALDLDGFFGMHPALRPLHDLYARKELAIVHAVGSPNATRSHFDAQDFMETAAPGMKDVRSGWLNRVLSDTACAECSGRTLANARAHAADHAAGQVGMATSATRGADALRAVALGAELPLSLRGPHPALAIPDLARFGVAGGGNSALESTFSRLYQTGHNDAVMGAAGDAFEAVRILQAADPSKYQPRDTVTYPPGDFGRSLRQIAQLIKADVGVEIAFADIGGWDTHFAQGGSEGQLARRLGELAQGIRALHDDLGERMDDVVLMTMSEFGRTVAENGSGGTDHGHANCMLVLGGSVAGGKIYGEWPGLEREQLYEGRDLAVTTDFRDVFAEVATRHVGVKHVDRVFPGYTVEPSRFRRFIV